jgi:AmmeMemoRadiSam system protein B
MEAMTPQSDVDPSRDPADRLVRRPAVAGAFYPSSPGHLEAQVDAMLEEADAAALPGAPLALIEPHAGYMYSGAVAAAGYRQLPAASACERVFLVGPSHRAAFQGVAAWDGEAFVTPLGEVPVDRDAIAGLIDAESWIVRRNGVHEHEHALEVQLPFLQRRLARFRLIPLVMGRQDHETCTRLGQALAAVAGGPGNLIIASSDLSHYHPYHEAQALDRRALEWVAAFDPEGLLGGLQRGECEACGGGPMAAVLFAARALGGREVHVLSYKNSGDVTGDRSQVVGYPACAII